MSCVARQRNTFGETHGSLTSITENLKGELCSIRTNITSRSQSSDRVVVEHGEAWVHHSWMAGCWPHTKVEDELVCEEIPSLVYHARLHGSTHPGNHDESRSRLQTTLNLNAGLSSYGILWSDQSTRLVHTHVTMHSLADTSHSVAHGLSLMPVSVVRVKPDTFGGSFHSLVLHWLDSDTFGPCLFFPPDGSLSPPLHTAVSGRRSSAAFCQEIPVCSLRSRDWFDSVIARMEELQD